MFIKSILNTFQTKIKILLKNAMKFFRAINHRQKYIDSETYPRDEGKWRIRHTLIFMFR